MLSNNRRQLLLEGVNDIVLVTFHVLDPKRSVICILIKHMLSLFPVLRVLLTSTPTDL